MTITNAFQKILDEPGCKQNKMCVDKSSQFQNIKIFFSQDYVPSFSEESHVYMYQKTFMMKNFWNVSGERTAKDKSNIVKS